MPLRPHFLFGGMLVVLLACVTAPPLSAQKTAAAASPPAAAPLSLGRHFFAVTTKSAAAQRAFNRGLILSYAFSHEAAEEEFRKAAQLDPQLAMAWWGVALVNGPHINYPLVPPEKAQTAWEALSKARALASGAGQLEQCLIAALAQRYANPQPEDRAPLDEAYAAAMRLVWQMHPRNADVGTLFAESLMDLHPWDLWTSEGKPQPWTDEIVVTLERALRLKPNQPGANHLLVHALESSPNPARALAAANRLQKLVPGASHLIHMPAHIYARVGRWDAAAASNVEAMKVDRLYRAAHAKPGFYAIYMAHNAHFLAFTAMMRGRGDEALRIGRQMIAEMPPDFLLEYGPFVDGYFIFASEVLMRFGRWNEILAEPKPPEGLPFSLAMWHFTRAVAFNALDRADDSRKEVASFLAASAALPDDYHFGNNSARDLLAIAALVLNGEIAARAGQFEAAISDLREAVRMEDTLRYDEPPDWIQPVRHTLGAVLLSAHRPGEAEQVYREDLQRFPENGWSLFGLKRSLQDQGKKAEAEQAARRFARAWATADVKIDSTCYCQAGR